jgi:hypothetical protein
LRRIHRAGSLARGRYEAGIFNPGSRNLAQIQGFEMAGKLLDYELSLAIEDGEASRGAAALHRLFELVRSMDHELTPHYQSLRMGGLVRAFACLERLLAEHPLPEPELLAFAGHAREAAERPELKARLLGFQCAVLEGLREIEQSLRGAGFPPPTPAAQLRLQLLRSIQSLAGTRDRIILQFVDGVDRFRPLESLPVEEWYRRGAEIERIMAALDGSSPRGWGIDARAAWGQVIRPAIELVAQSRAVEAALAVERYRLRHDGRLPETLEALVPVFLPEAPRDPFDGAPIRYRRLEPGFCVYSIGSDESDDGGLRAAGSRRRVDPSGADIVFSVRR